MIEDATRESMQKIVDEHRLRPDEVIKAMLVVTGASAQMFIELADGEPESFADTCGECIEDSSQ